MRPEWQRRTLRLAAAAVAALALLEAWLALGPMTRALAALIVVVVPGYLLGWPVLRPRFGSAGAFAIAGGLSIGVVALAGLALNLLPWGLQAATWLGCVLVLLVIGVALGRRPWSWRPKVTVAAHEVVLAGIGAITVMAALVFARSFAAYPTESFTQLSIIPASDAPTSSVEVRIRNEERAPTSYRLEVLRNGAPVTSVASIRLTNGQTWKGMVFVGSGQIEARLYVMTDPGALYRHVTLQLGGAAQTTPGPGASP
jgi:uncharacterized membrane protein